MQEPTASRRTAAAAALCAAAMWWALGAALVAQAAPPALAPEAAQRWAQELLARFGGAEVEQAQQLVVLRNALDELERRRDFAAMAAGADLLWTELAAGWAQAEIGQRLAVARRFDSAATVLRRAVDADASVGVVLLLAATEWELGEVEVASARFEAAAELSRLRGDEAALYRALRQHGALLLWAGEFADAVRVLDRAAELSPAGSDHLLQLDRARAWAALARAAAESAGAGSGQSRQRDAQLRARDLFADAVRRMPQNAEVRYGLARVLQELGDDEGAARELAAYQRLYQEDQRRIRSQGRYRAQLAEADRRAHNGDLAAAVAVLEGVPPRIEALERLADLYLEMGEVPAAIAALQRAVALFPDRTDLMVRINSLLLAE